MQRLELVAWVQVWAESHGHVEPVYITAGEIPVIALLTSVVIPLQFYTIFANMAVHSDILDEKAYSKHEEFADGMPHEANVLTPEELVTEKKLRRKIDLLIMPLVVLVYLMNYIDR